MGCLCNHGINLEMSTLEFERSITWLLSTDSISSIKNALFIEASEAGLVSAEDTFVKRRKTHDGKAVKQKHVADIWQLVCTIKNKTLVPRHQRIN